LRGIPGNGELVFLANKRVNQQVRKSGIFWQVPDSGEDSLAERGDQCASSFTSGSAKLVWEGDFRILGVRECCVATGEDGGEITVVSVVSLCSDCSATAETCSSDGDTDGEMG